MLTQKELKHILHYNAETGFFTWLIANNGNIKVRKIAGTLKNNGYISITINKKLYQAHRLAFLYMEGEFPNDCVDHVNYVRNDNRWCNIRKATKLENSRNVGLRKDNTSGYKGVYWSSADKKWRAQISVNGKRKLLGMFNSPELASVVYENFSKQIHNDFYYNITRK
jgi:hypothetical protein